MKVDRECENVLNGINCLEDIKKLDTEELKRLAEDLREKILTATSKNGGHLSSNLGIIETTIALHRVFDFSKDKLIFDVGHQCYAHKILTGRKDNFSTLRTEGGISGFPDREESECDAFIAGHAGTSIAAGLGYCLARDNNKEDYCVIDVVGDGALVNGLNQEALTLSATKPKNYIVILNDNGMSISKNRNGFYRYLSKRTTKKGYLRGKKALKRMFGTSFINRGLVRFRDFIKRILNKSVYFENYGFKYVGVVDGNDIKTMVSILENVKEVAKEKAVFLHIKTTKGKGFEKAEEHSDLYHGVGCNLKCETGSFSTALGKNLCDFIEKDKSVVAITAGMKDGTGLCLVEEKFPQNFVDVGIAEELAVTMAAGMAAGGLRPYVAVYSTFMQRAYDQIIHDICLQNLPVTLCIDRAGFVGKDGKTHQGLFDISYLSHLPNMRIYAPCSLVEFEDILKFTKDLNCPVAIRYPKNTVEKTEKLGKFLPLADNPWVRVKEGDKITILAVGPRMLELALNCATDGVGIINARTVKPLCEKTLKDIKDSLIITLEENSILGGFGSTVLNFYSKKGYANRVVCLGAQDGFVPHGSVEYQMTINGLTCDNLKSIICKELGIKENEQEN